MSLNWVLTTQDGTRPEPLPAEKVLYRAPPCQLHLEFKHVQTPAKWDAETTVTVTNQRVVFLRHPPLPPPADPSQPSPHLRSLAVPLLGNLVSVKYAMPIFAAPHLELVIHPVRDGGLPQDAVEQRNLPRDQVEHLAGRARVTFRDGGGTLLKDAIDRALRNPVPLAGGRVAADPDPLPLYQEPPPPGPPAGTAVPSDRSQEPTHEVNTAEHPVPAPLAAQGSETTEEPPPYAG